MYPTHDFLYQKKGFVTKTNLKANIHYGGNEDEAQEMCYKHIKSFRNAIDIGSRFGGWSREMGNKFEHLYAFEPRDKWLKVYPINIRMDNVTLYPYGLGDKEEIVPMQGNRITFNPKLEFQEKVNVKTLDTFKLKRIDFIKIDTDGYELNVLKGGTKLILRNKPVICMEVIPGAPYFGELAQEYLINLGAKIIDHDGHNYLFSW